MPTVFARQTTTVFSIIIACLLILCIGLLVAVLKGQIYHENSIAASVSSHRVGVTTEKPTNENNIPTVHQLPNAIQTNGESSTEMVTEDILPRSSTWENFRLSPHVKPLHYDLLLHPNLKTDNFTGTVKITVNLTELIDHFVMHAFRLTVFNPKVYNVHERTEVQVRQTFLYDPNEFYVIELESAVKPGIYEIELNFSGSLVDKIVGFYKSRYVNSATNETRYLATSKFQPTYARRAFPCFDEPSFKSTFTVSLVHDAEHIALSNMPATGTSSYLDDDLKITKFEKSVPMVTYLICFIVCDFEYKKTTTKGGKEFRVYATKDNVHSVEYAVDFGSKVLNFFEDYFAIEYSLPKQDMVAIPDFVSGAMEHWGVITFRETNILYDPMKSSPQNKQRVSEVISHEMAHMWFGNLVTMEWWDDLWLNEGFASYIEYKGVDDLHPEWHMLEQFVTDSLQPVMDIDSTISSHPIVQSVSHPDEITEIFDDISYNKGASILRMLEFFTGADTFREGISRFLKKYKYQNARTQDLWEELSNHNQNELNISEIMGTWTQQMGFPFVTVTRDPQNPSMFKAKQQRFVKNREIYTLYQDDKEYIWHVPLSYITSTGESGIIWLRNSSSGIFEIPVSNSDWVKFNINQTGYYIVNYDDEGWQRMIDLLKTNHEVLTPSDRSNLIFDAFLLAEAGHIKYDILLSMLTYLKNESHLVPWETAYASLVYLSRLLEATEVDSLIKRYINEITGPLYWKLGWEETEDHLDNLLRNTIIGLACHSGNRDCLDTTALLLKNWTTGFEIPTTLRRLVYHYGMKEVGNEEYWNLMWNRYMKEESPQERKTLLYGLSHVRKSTLIHRFLDHAMNESEIRRQDFFSVLTYLAGNPIARRIVWNFLRNKWEALVNRFSLNDRYLGLSVKKICTFFTTEDEYNEMRTFFAKYPDAGAGKRRRQQALENVQNNIKWLKTYQDQMRTLFLVESPSPWLHYKLPPHIIPQHYDLILQPDIGNSNFTGSVSINIEITTPSNYILVHARGLNISKTEISNVERNSEESPSLLFNFSNNTYWVIQFPEKLPSGKYKLCFEFSGNFSDLGMFKEKYTDLNNTVRAIMATQFEDTYARNVFPCFDEPTFKTTFNISIIHSPEYTALSNTMELESKILENGLKMTRFEKTVPMVTYLVCIVIGDIDFKESYIDSGARLRVYAVSHNVEKTAYALETGKALLNIFEKYFGYPYPLKKIDFIAVPGGRFGMENWGLVLFGDAGILVDNSSSKADIERVTILIAHELAHMWFGNLVTMKWWDDLWLNEGFATYISYKGVDTLHPSYNYMADFILGPLSIALRKDGSVFSRPIVQTTRTSTDIGQMFDSISYDKGASILRMLETLMGDDFRNGVSAYLKKYAYQNVNTDDLWSELTLASKKELDVKMLMNTWTKQMNYPFINVTRSETDRRYVTLSQHRYVLKNESTVWEDDSPYNYVWHVPLTYHTSDNSTLQSLMLNSTNKLTMKLPQSEWIKFNVNFTGYYLVNYDVKDWHHFIDILKTNHTIFNQMDRSNLLHDSFALSKAGHLSYNISLELFSYLRNETEWIPWSIASGILAQLKLIEYAVGGGVAFREFVRNLSKGLYRKLAWKEAEDIPGRILRNTIMEISCKYRNIECLREAKSLFKRWLAGESIDPEYRSLVYFYGIQTIKDESSFKLMLEKYANEKSYDEKIDILKGLANTRNFTHCEWLIRTSENESRVDKDDYLYSLKMMSHNPYCSIFVLDFVLKNWTQLQMRFPTQKRSMAGLVKDIFRTVRAEHVLKQLQSFFKKYPDAVTAKEKVQIVDGIWHRINWILTDGVEIHNWLSEHTYMPWFNLRLPDHTVPSKYDLRVRANVTTGFFDGDVNITVNVVKPTDYIAVHASTLDVTAIELQDLSTSENVQIEEEFPLPHNEIWVIRFLKKIPPGGYKLYMKYAGSSTTQLRKGVKTDTYIHNITKEEVPFFYTTFEPTYARRFFPCFDEPSLKASFRLTVVHEPHHVVISNMPDENNFTRTDGLIETQFMESVVMSTYLLCVVISDFTYKETDITHGKKLRFYAPPDRVNNTLHTLEVAPKFLEILEEYYGIPYQLPKLDFVAIPKFPSKGMENWGLIQYTDYLLVTEDMPRDKVFDSDRVVAHELAHMWFGNLVTMCWWNDLWLNEGFSSFAMFIPLRPLYPDVDELTVLYSERGRIKDADYESRPIIHNVSNPGEIRSMFDEISYKKGSAVLKMLANFMKDDFRKGVMNYLKKYAFKNAETNDFWNELSSISNTGINITDVMNTWTRQRGYPYIEIQVDDDHFTASQRLFLLNTEIPEGKEMMKSDYGYTWKIPLTFKNIDTGEEQSYWFNGENATFPLNNSAENCLKFNVNYSGYYIVKYDEKGWNCLRNKLLNNHEDFSSVDRINILFDSYLLAEANHIMYDVPLELSKYLRKEKNFGPWMSARINFFGQIHRYLKAGSTNFKLFQNYTCYLIDNIYQDVLSNSTGRSDLDGCVKAYAKMCQHPKYIESRIPELNRWLSGERTPGKEDISGLIPHFENETIWEELWNQYLNTNMSAQRHESLNAFSKFHDKELLQRTMNEALTNKELGQQEILDIFDHLLDNPRISDEVWSFIKSNWTQITNRSGDMHMLLSTRSYAITTEEELEDLTNVAHTFEAEFTDFSYAKKRIKWIRKNEETIANWLKWNVLEGNLT